MFLRHPSEKKFLSVSLVLRQTKVCAKQLFPGKTLALKKSLVCDVVHVFAVKMNTRTEMATIAVVLGVFVSIAQGKIVCSILWFCLFTPDVAVV